MGVDDMFSKKFKYTAKEAGSYTSARYSKPGAPKIISWDKGYGSDGATGLFVQDLDIRSSRVHDIICDRGTWDDGTPITNWQASNVYCDSLCDSANAMIGKNLFLKKKLRKARAQIRKIGTFVLGGRKLKKW